MPRISGMHCVWDISLYNLMVLLFNQMGSVSRQEVKLAELKREITGIRLDLQHGYHIINIQYHNELQMHRVSGQSVNFDSMSYLH